MRTRLATLTVLAFPAVMSDAAKPSKNIEEMLSLKWMSAYDSGDSKKLGGVYAADARLDHGYCPAVVGRSAIEEFWRVDLGEDELSTDLTVTDSFTSGDIAYLSGSYDVLDEKENSKRISGGRFTQIWLRDDDENWTILRESWKNLSCAKIRIGEPDEGKTEPVKAVTSA